MPIYFHNEGISFLLKKKKEICLWLTEVINQQGKTLKDINFIFCSDVYLHNINKSYLKHDYFTDVITFDYSENKFLSGDIYISIDRVKDFSKTNKISFHEEMHRVIVHGILHLCGRNDKTNEEKKEMRSLEDKYLGLRGF